MLSSLLALAFGIAAFLFWSKGRGSWPFAPQPVRERADVAALK
jgi:hypothetical protein